MAESHSEVSSQATNRDALLFRKPKRITVTVPDQIYRTLLERSTREGRSISNLAAYLLERAVASEKRRKRPSQSKRTYSRSQSRQIEG
jgi:hypothetical protein